MYSSKTTKLTACAGWLPPGRIQLQGPTSLTQNAKGLMRQKTNSTPVRLNLHSNHSFEPSASDEQFVSDKKKKKKKKNFGLMTYLTKKPTWSCNKGQTKHYGAFSKKKKKKKKQ